MKPISRPLVAFAGATPPPALVRALHDQGIDVVNGAVDAVGDDAAAMGGVATVVISKWENELDQEKMNNAMAG